MAGVELYPPDSYPHILLEYADHEFGFGEYWEAFCLARQAWKVEVDPNTRKKISFYVDTYAIYCNTKENDPKTILFLEPNQSSPEEVTAQFKKLMSDIHLQNISSVAVPGARKLMEKAYQEIMEKLSNNRPVSKRKRDDEPKCNSACLKDCMKKGYSYLEGVEELLCSLRQNNYEMHTFTNYPIWYEMIEDKLQISRYLSWTFRSCKNGKLNLVRILTPLGERGGQILIFYLDAPEHLEVDSANCIFVDDRTKNVEAAIAELASLVYISRMRTSLHILGLLGITELAEELLT